MPHTIMISDIHYDELKAIISALGKNHSFDTIVGRILIAGTRMSGTRKLFAEEIRSNLLRIECEYFLRRLKELDLMSETHDFNDFFVPVTLLVNKRYSDLYFLLEQKITMLGDMGDQLADIRKENKPARKKGRSKK